MKVYVVIVDEMICENGVVDESSINRDVMQVCSSLNVAVDFLKSNRFEQGDMPNYDMCSFHRISDCYWLTYDNMIDGTEVVECAWVEERELIDSVSYVYNDNDMCLAKCCGNCKDFAYCTRNGKFNDEADSICDKFVLNDYARIEYMD